MLLLSVLLVVGSAAFGQAGSAERGGTEDIHVDAETFLAADPTDLEGPRAGGAFDHYDADGYPEDEAGLLVLRDSSDGPLIDVRDEDLPFLLYAQYANTQRDAVILARTGTITDVTPDGRKHEVPYGFGVLKLNTVFVSVVEARLVPHISDNRKEYVEFPLEDFYVGTGLGTSGLTASARYVHRERIVGVGSVGLGLIGGFWVPVHVGGGYRFSLPLPDFLGSLHWTVGGGLLLGLAEKARSARDRAAALLPGVFVDVERSLLDSSVVDRDYRSDPRPYNYHVHSVGLRIGVDIDIGNIGTGAPVLLPSVSFRYLYNIIGPKIPPHEFKETTVLYVHELYREDLKRQEERRQERAERASRG